MVLRFLIALGGHVRAATTAFYRRSRGACKQASCMVMLAAWGSGLTGCSGSQQNASGVLCQTDVWLATKGLRVLCTTAQIADLAAFIVGEEGAVLTLILGDLDPHSYQLVKGDDEKLQAADLVIGNGLGLEHGPSLQHFLLHSPKALLVGNQLLKSYGDQILYLEGQIDPHIWLDVALWSEIAPMIAEALGKLDEAHAVLFRERAQQLQQQMKELDSAIFKRLQGVPKERRYLVTSHDAFNYFVRKYLATDQDRRDGSWSARLCAPEGLAPEGQLGLHDIQRVLEFCSAHDVQVLFPESNVSQMALRKVLDVGLSRGLHLRIASHPLYGDTMGQIRSCGSVAAYQSMMEENAKTLTMEWSSL